jgi:hypothetical protein
MTRYAPLALISLVGLVVGCGGSSHNASTSTPQPPTRGFSAAPISRGYYAGVQCSSSSCSDYSSAHDQSAEYCYPSGSHHPSHPQRYSSTLHPSGGGSYEEVIYVCFRLDPANPSQTSATPNLVKDFYFAGQRILGTAHVSSDSFPSTCDNGWCVSGEWFGTRLVRGQIRNPGGATAYYRATRVG